MRLIASLTSPFARKVRIVLFEKRIDCPMTVDVPWNADTQVSSFNPLGKVPVLVFEDGHTLFDSSIIVDYLDAISPVSQLVPKDRQQAIQVRRWEALADGICDAAATSFLERKRPVGQQNEEWISRQHLKIELGLKALAADLGENRWCYEKAYSLADIAVGCCLGYLDLRFPEIPWRESHSNLARLAERLAQRPAFVETMPPAA